MNNLNTFKKYGLTFFQKRSGQNKSLNQTPSTTQFQRYRQKGVDRGEKALVQIQEDLQRGERSLLETRLEQLYSAFDLVMLTDEAIKLLSDNKAKAQAETSVPNYLISSWFLADCWAFLTSNPHGHERLHLVSGIKLSPRERTLDRLVKVSLSGQSAVHASAEQHDLSTTLIELDERWGHSLHGLFHSHPGKGASATLPSSTDFATHRRYETGGYPLIGAIFVLDGFVRFFSEDKPFTITIYGKGVSQHDEHVFKINA
jgi:hypothetical protein